MEQNEEYKRVEGMIRDIEQQLALCNNTSQTCEVSGRDAEREIEEHFARVMNNLAARKQVLLREVEQKVANQRMSSYIGDININI